jgi:hypothetical protein
MAISPYSRLLLNIAHYQANLHLDHVTRKVQEARKQRDQLLRKHASENIRIKIPTEDTRAHNLPEMPPVSRGRSAVVVAGLAAALTACILTGWGFWSRDSNEAQGATISLPVPGNAPVGTTVVEKELEFRLNILVEQVALLSGSVVELGDKLERAHVIANSLVDASKEHSAATALPINRTDTEGNSVQATAPATANIALNTEKTINLAASRIVDSAEPDFEVQAGPIADLSYAEERTAATVGTTNAQVTEVLQAPAVPKTLGTNRMPSEDRSIAVAQRKGPWVINLLSSPIKADADRFESRLEAAGTQTEQQEVFVKGKTYWRVQIVGFSSLADARAHADLVTEQFALKDAWVMKR